MSAFYPNRSYIEQDKAPEFLAQGTSQLANLANVIRTARSNGIELDDRDAMALLRNAMVENRPDFGTNVVSFRRGKWKNDNTGVMENRADYRRAETDRLIKAMGFEDPVQVGEKESYGTVGYWQDPQDPKRNSFQVETHGGIPTKFNNKGQPVKWKQLPDEDLEDNSRAYVMRALMKMKEAKHKNLGDLFESTEWNGTGRNVMRDQNGRVAKVLADAPNHRNKIGLMNNPHNQKLFNLFQTMLDKGGYETFYDARDYQNRQ